MARLVATSIAFALGRSSTTSRMAPRRATRSGPSVKSVLPDDTDERIDRNGAALFGADHQRIDVELEQAVGVLESKGLHGQDGVDDGIDVASRAAPIAGEQRRQHQREEGLG